MQKNIKNDWKKNIFKQSVSDFKLISQKDKRPVVYIVHISSGFGSLFFKDNWTTAKFHHLNIICPEWEIQFFILKRFQNVVEFPYRCSIDENENI